LAIVDMSYPHGMGVAVSRPGSARTDETTIAGRRQRVVAEV
jgi:hypothetical protein